MVKENIKLAECPCCRHSYPVLVDEELIDEPCGDRHYIYIVECHNCGLRTSWSTTPEIAAAKWNRRSDG